MKIIARIHLHWACEIVAMCLQEFLGKKEIGTCEFIGKALSCLRFIDEKTLTGGSHLGDLTGRGWKMAYQTRVSWQSARFVTDKNIYTEKDLNWLMGME